MKKLATGLAAVVAAALAAIMVLPRVMLSGPEENAATKAPATQQEIAFNPPALGDAPPAIRDAVMFGYQIMSDTPTFAPAYTGNKLSCTNCHFNAGRSPQSIPLAGVAAAYPKFRERTRYATDLAARTNECFERSMNGRALPTDSREMQAVMAYLTWISKDVPIYARVPWLGLKRVISDHKPDRVAGELVYEKQCSHCHGQTGRGSPDVPPLWGPDSFNDGAGMADLQMLASFVHANMPPGAPNLSADQAFDVAAYVAAQPRPHFERR